MFQGLSFRITVIELEIYAAVEILFSELERDGYIKLYIYKREALNLVYFSICIAEILPDFTHRNN